MPDNIKRTPELAEFVIQGVTKEGETFRPSNWGERLSDMLSTTGKDGRIMYSSYVRPMLIGGLPCVVVRFSLEKADPKGFELVKQFIIANNLKVRAGRDREQVGATGLFPTIHMDRRTGENNAW